MAATLSFATGAGINSSSNVSSYTGGAFTPAQGDLMVVGVVASGTVANDAKVTDSQGHGYDLIGRIGFNSSADSVYLFVSRGFMAASSTTLTFDCTSDPATGCLMGAIRAAGMSQWGTNAIRQGASVANQLSGSTPSFNWPGVKGNSLPQNPLIGVVGCNGAAAGFAAPPSGWTEDVDTAYTVPATGAEVVRIDGQAGSGVTWGAAITAGSYAAFAVELDSGPNVVNKVYSQARVRASVW